MIAPSTCRAAGRTATSSSRRCRNQPGGFWVASTRPEAAHEAIYGRAGDVTEVALLTDGVVRLADWYGWDWRMLDVLRHEGGPAELIRRVRDAERARAFRSGRSRRCDGNLRQLRAAAHRRARDG